MQIILKELHIRNFRGIKDLSIDFSAGETAIFGANRVGKSTVMVAFLWLLFSKDNENRLDFEIKPRRIDGKVTDKTETEVSAIIIADGEIIEIRKLYREKWGKSKGVAVESFTGHEKEHFIQNVPHNAGDFKKAIDALIPEELFKLLTNPDYFNENIDWTKRRSVLQKMAGEIPQYAIEAAMGTLTDAQKLVVIKFTTSGKPSVDRLKELRANRLKLQEEHDNVPVKINEVKRLVPEESNFELIEHQIAEELDGIKALEASINDKSVYHNSLFKDLQAKQAKVMALQTSLGKQEMKLKSDYFTQISTYDIEGSRLKGRLETISADIKSKKLLLESTGNQLLIKNDRITNLRSYFADINQDVLEFKDSEDVCPTCKRPYDAEHAEASRKELTENFNRKQAIKKAEIQAEGKGIAGEMGILESTRETLTKAITSLVVEQKELAEKLEDYNTQKPVEPDFEKIFAADSTYKLISDEMAILNAEMGDIPELDVEALKARRFESQQVVEELRKELNNKGQIEKGQIRIIELEQQERDLAQEIALNEQETMLIQAFERASMTLVSESVNKLFQFVRFELFTQNINGGWENDCITTWEGTRWDTLNTAGRVQAGIDIINTLSKFYGHTAPIFIDNRESITDIPVTESQVIDLVVSPDDLTLRIEQLN